jgi:hypothetical protein
MFFPDEVNDEATARQSINTCGWDPGRQNGLHLLLLRPTIQHRDATTTVPNISLPPLNPSASMLDRQDEDNDELLLVCRLTPAAGNNGELNLLLPDSGCPLQAGTGDGLSGRALGRCGCAVTSLRGGRGGGAGGSVGVLRARRRAGFQQCKSFVEMCDETSAKVYARLGLISTKLPTRTALY